MLLVECVIGRVEIRVGVDLRGKVLQLAVTLALGEWGRVGRQQGKKTTAGFVIFQQRGRTADAEFAALAVFEFICVDILQSTTVSSGMICTLVFQQLDLLCGRLGRIGVDRSSGTTHGERLVCGSEGQHDAVLTVFPRLFLSSSIEKFSLARCERQGIVGRQWG